jgi:hypothetical protein
VMGDCEVVHLGGRKDGGIDIKAVRGDGRTTLIQVKRRSDFGRREGVQVISTAGRGGRRLRVLERSPAGG